MWSFFIKLEKDYRLSTLIVCLFCFTINTQDQTHSTNSLSRYQQLMVQSLCRTSFHTEFPKPTSLFCSGKLDFQNPSSQCALGYARSLLASEEKLLEGPLPHSCLCQLCSFVSSKYKNFLYSQTQF